jgi:hypothetical protein
MNERRTEADYKTKLKAFLAGLVAITGNERDLSYVDKLTEERAKQILEIQIGLTKLNAGNISPSEYDKTYLKTKE